MLEKSYCLLLNKLSDHITQDSSNRVKPLIGCANVRETDIVEENLLHNKDCDSFAQF